MKIAYKIFKNELGELITFYDTTLTAYDILNEDKNNLNPQLKTNELEFELRQLILVKLISILEQYLIDNVKFIFGENKVPFKNKEIITFQKQEILSFKTISEVQSKIISKDCRQLSSGGLDKIIKYYKSKFNLNLDSFFPSKERIIEYHDRRHLHVHNLGKTDKYYRKKYNTTKSGTSINDEYIRNAFEDISAFGEIVNKNTLKYLNSIDGIEDKELENRTIWFSFQNLTSDLDLIKEDYSFWSNDDLVVLRDILSEIKTLPDNFIEIKLYGNQTYVKDYYNILRKTTKKNSHIKYLNKLFDDYIIKTLKKEKTYTPPTPKVIITDDFIQEVKKLLPPQPWEIGIHKKIALQLNQSNKTISKVIRIILNNE